MTNQSENPGLLFKHGYQLVSVAALFILGVGTVFYHWVEGWSWLDSLYFCVVTLATVGYGDFTPQTELGKIFTMFYILFGIGIIVTFTNTLIQRITKRRQEKLELRSDRSSKDSS